MEPWNFVLGPRIMDYEEFIFDIEELPNGDFVLWLAIKDLPETAIYFVNPSAEFVQTWIKRARLDVTAQKYDFMRLFLYLSRLQFVNRGYSI